MAETLRHRLPSPTRRSELPADPIFVQVNIGVELGQNSYMSNDSLLTIAAGPASVSVDPAAGGRLATWTIDGMQLLVERDSGNHPFGWGSYPMVPFAGRIRRGRFSFEGQTVEMPINMAPHAIHGTGYDATWEVLAHTRNTLVLVLRLVDPWPFPGTVTHIMQIRNDRLVQQMTVTGGRKNQPVTFGWHPWFRRNIDGGGPLALHADLTGARVFLRDDDYIPSGELVPVGERPWDDCFEGVRSIGLHWPGALAIDVLHDCPCVVMYDPDHAICVEPQSGPPNAVTVQPASAFLGMYETREHTVTWKWSMASRP